MTICLAAVATTKYFLRPFRCCPHTGLLGDLQVVFTNYLVCKTLSANIDFGNLYAAEKKKGEKQKEYSKTAKSTRQCSREQRQQQQRQRAALGVDGRPRGAEIRSILFGARNHHKSHADVIKAAFCTALVCIATSPAMSLLRRARHVMCATCRRRAGILCFSISLSLSLSSARCATL